MALQKFGHQAEDFLLMALPAIGIRVVDRKVVGTDPGCPFAIASSCDRKDLDDGFDFWFWIRTVGWIKVDLTTARKPEVISKKRSRSDVVTLCINFRTLELSSRGCERDICILETIFMSLVKEFVQ